MIFCRTNLDCDNLEKYLNQGKTLPLVLPIVIYNGSQKYDAPLNMWELFEEPALAKEIMTGDYRLIDLEAMSDDEFKKEKHFAFALYVMKHIHERDTFKMLEKALKHCLPAIIIDSTKDHIHIKSVLCYTGDIIEIEKTRELETVLDGLLSTNEEEIMRTIADGYRDEGYEIGFTEGIEKGREEGREEGVQVGIEKMALASATQMLKDGLSPELIQKYTKLTNSWRRLSSSPRSRGSRKFYYYWIPNAASARPCEDDDDFCQRLVNSVYTC